MKENQLPVCHTTWNHRVYLAFLFSLWKGVQTEALPKFHREILHSRTTRSAKFPCIQRRPLEAFGNVRFVSIQSIWIVNMLIVDVHFNIGKNWVRNAVYMSNERNWNLLLLLRFHIHFSLFFVLLFLLLCYFEFRNNDPWNISETKPSTSVWNQRNRSDPFEIQSLNSFHQVR